MGTIKATQQQGKQVNFESIEHGAERVEIYDVDTHMFTVYTVETVFSDPISGTIVGVEYQLSGDDETACEFDKDSFRLLW